MSKSQKNRNIDLSRARVQTRTPKPENADPASAQSRTVLRPQPPAAENKAQRQEPEISQPKKQNKKHPAGRKRNKVAAVVLCVVLILSAAVGGVFLYADSLMNESELGSFETDSAAHQNPAKETIVPPDMEGVRNILVLGLDYDSDDPVERDSKHPNTDMIMYVRLDANEHGMKMIQFPRDIFVAQAGGESGKINGILAKNVDAGNGLGALKDYIETSFGLPVDNYVTIDVDGLKAVVDAFYGVEVYVPRDMRYYNEKTHQVEGELLKGWRKLNGEQCEFFLRYRQGLPRSDIDRLVMQRQFYAALFRRLQTATVSDIVKLLPVAEYYLRTDIGTLDLMSMAIEVSTMDAANIAMGRIPVYGTDTAYNQIHLPVVVAKAETAAFLNEYFRPEDQPITAEDIGTPQWPTVGGSTETAMSTMTQIASEGMDETH